MVEETVSSSNGGEENNSLFDPPPNLNIAQAFKLRLYTHLVKICYRREEIETNTMHPPPFKTKIVHQ